MKKIIMTSLLTLGLMGCASKPQLYPNQKLQTVGKEKANQDIKQCTELADKYLESGTGKRMAKGAGAGAVVGAAVGGALGLFTGNVGRGLVRGGTVGAVAGGAQGAMTPDQIKRNFVNKCLAERGYEVIGWD
jgi:outer membrane lipoprotein SlyB